jgi:type VI secretion system secreted protein Hcp
MGIYWKHEGIDGDATQKGYEGYTNCHDFKWSFERKFATDQVGRAFNREGAQAIVGRVTLTKEADHASGQILKTACTEHRGKPSEIAFVRTGDPGDPYLKFTLSNALFSQLQVMAFRSGDSERPTEQIELDFTKMEIEAVVLNESNGSDETLRIEYDIATGKGS